MTTQHPEALRLAAELDHGYPLTGDAISAAAELRSQHARITELEAQLSAIVAGGVSPLMAVAERWVSVDERLPEPQKPVLLDIGKQYPIRAQMVPQYALTVGTDAADDFGEYDEETDEWYCPAGWYEWNQQEEIHWAVNDKPIAWHELPAAPSIAGESNG